MLRVLQMLSTVVWLSLTVSMIHADETEVDIVALQKTVKSLAWGGHIPFVFTDEPMSEILDFCSTARDIDFCVESADILTERVSVNIAGKPLVDSLQQTLFMHGCEMAVLTDGRMLIRRTPEPVLAMRQFLKAMQRQPKPTPWKERASLMTEQGFMELAGNLVWLALDQMHETSIEEFGAKFGAILERYGAADIALPPGAPPYIRTTTQEEMEASRQACEVRNRMFRRVLAGTGGKVYAFLDDIESLMAEHDLPLPRFDAKLKKQTLDTNSATVVVVLDIKFKRNRGFMERVPDLLELEFRRVGDGWKYHQSRD